MIYMIYGDNEDMEMRMLYNDAWQGCGAIVNDGGIIRIYPPLTPAPLKNNSLAERVSTLVKYLIEGIDEDEENYVLNYVLLEGNYIPRLEGNDILLETQLLQGYRGLLRLSLPRMIHPQFSVLDRVYAFDKLHEQYQSWRNCVLIKGDIFEFSHSELGIEKGEIVDLHEVCDFEYYFIDVT